MDGNGYKVYMLRCVDGSFYTGITTDVERRVSEHRSGGPKAARYTRVHGVAGVEAVWEAGNRSQASALEYRIKRLSHDQKSELAACPARLERYRQTWFASGDCSSDEANGKSRPGLSCIEVSGSERGNCRIKREIEDDFDLERIAESGQCFRWTRVSDGCYRVIHDEECVYIEDEGERLFGFDCEEAAFGSIWRDYLDLDENYAAVRARIDADADPFLWRASEHEKGIRILRQDPWEALVSFIISQNKNIPAIQKSIELLAATAGEYRMDVRGCEYHGFPSAEAIASLTREELMQCKLGYRWEYVQAAAHAVLDGAIDLEALKRADEDEAIRSLTELHGVGPKVASCVSLFGLHHTNAFPIDTWMKKALTSEYPQGYPFDEYRPYNGVYQQYIFAFYRNRSKVGRPLERN